jgi:hypothetical protein
MLTGQMPCSLQEMACILSEVTCTFHEAICCYDEVTCNQHEVVSSFDRVAGLEETACLFQPETPKFNEYAAFLCISALSFRE